MTALVRRLDFWLLLLLGSCFSQVTHNGSIQFISQPANIAVYSPQYGFIGRTPCLFNIPWPIPAHALQSGVWQPGPFTAQQNDGTIITIHPKLTITDDMKQKVLTQNSLDYCWIFTIPVAMEHEFQTNEISSAGNFFACNHWVDKNLNGMVEQDEWFGIKEHYRPNETITFVAYINKGVGTEFKYELRDPDNNMADLTHRPARKGPATPTISTETTKFDQSVIRAEYLVRDLIGCPTQGSTAVSPAGDWKMYWYIEGTLVNITQVSLK